MGEPRRRYGPIASSSRMSSLPMVILLTLSYIDAVDLIMVSNGVTIAATGDFTAFNNLNGGNWFLLVRLSSLNPFARNN